MYVFDIKKLKKEIQNICSDITKLIKCTSGRITF